MKNLLKHVINEFVDLRNGSQEIRNGSQEKERLSRNIHDIFTSLISQSDPILLLYRKSSMKKSDSSSFEPKIIQGRIVSFILEDESLKYNCF